MSEQEINVAIAEACGWKLLRHADDGRYAWFDARRVKQSRWHLPEPSLPAWGLPDWTNDLNAMREAIESLDDLSKYNVMVKLESIAGDTRVAVMQSTARQRAEAFLRAIGKWRE